jgi:hypothetical protein
MLTDSKISFKVIFASCLNYGELTWFCVIANLESNLIQLDTLFLGGGPATLGTITSYIKSGKINDLMMGKGFAIVEASTSFGGGALLDYGIRSNTSAKGFIKLICKQTVKAKGDESIVEKIHQSISISKKQGDTSNGRSQSYAPNIRKNSRVKNLADSFSNTLQKKHKEMKEEKQMFPKLKQVRVGKS